MNKKFLSAILFGALVASTGSFVSCADNDDKIDQLQDQNSELKAQLAQLKSELQAELKNAASASQVAAIEAKLAAIEAAKAVTGKPTLIIGKCVMGKGALKADGSSYEANCKTHGAPLGGDATANTVRALGGNVAFVSLDDGAYVGKTEAEAFDVVAVTGVHTVELLEDVLQLHA